MKSNIFPSFEWDENKRIEIIRKRQVDLLMAALIFDGDVYTTEDTRHDYGEKRFRSIGRVDDQFYVVIHTQRGSKTRLITAWKANEDDRRIYQNSIAG